MANRRVLALDFGASSGRAMLGIFDGKKITLEEIHRFPNDPVFVNGVLYWDTWRLYHEIKQGMLKGHKAGGFESIGIDTWGVDFGLIRKDGSLVEQPVHYRDTRTKGLVLESFKKITQKDFYSVTGIQFMELNTVFQLFSLSRSRKHILDETDTLLLMPDLFNYFLTGIKKTEYSIASTTQMLDANTGFWSSIVLSALEIPQAIFTDIIPSGTILGSVLPEICEELSIPSSTVIAVCGHDTQSAIVSVPTRAQDFIFISCGTWSLFGTELRAPIIDERSASLNITNEGGFGGKITFLKNIIGLWLLQESRRQWEKEGTHFTFDDLARMTCEVKPFQNFIDPDASDFLAPGDIPARIRAFCKNTGQTVPETIPEVVLCIYQSLALKYRWALTQIESCTGKAYSSIHMVGGGTRDSLLCQYTSNACGRPVYAGPSEATVLGNIAVQLISLGDIANVTEAREIISASQPLAVYAPVQPEMWDEIYYHFIKVCAIR